MKTLCYRHLNAIWSRHPGHDPLILRGLLRDERALPSRSYRASSALSHLGSLGLLGRFNFSRGLGFLHLQEQLEVVYRRVSTLADLSFQSAAGCRPLPQVVDRGATILAQRLGRQGLAVPVQRLTGLLVGQVPIRS